MKFVKIIFIILFINLYLYSEDYTIVVKSNKKKENVDENIILSNENQFHYSLDKILEKEIGFIIQKYGGEGSYSLIRIRGSNANQVNIYLDGIPLNFASYSEVNVSDLHVFNYKTIQIEKNGSITGLVGSSIGGSINLVPSFSKENNQIYIQGGSYKTFGGGIFYQKLNPKGDILLDTSKEKNDDNIDNYNGGWNISLYRETSDQNFKFRNHNGTIYFNTTDDFNDIRKNSQYKKTSSLLNGFINLHQTQIRILNDTFYRNHGIPGPITRQTEKTSREHLRNTTGLFTDSKALIWENFRLKSRIYYTYINNNFKDPKNELSFGANSSKAYLHNKGIHLLPQWIFILPNTSYKLNLLLGYEEEYFFEDKYTSFGLKALEVPEKKRYHYSYHLSNELSFFDDILILNIEGRYEEYKNNFFIETRTKTLLTIEEFNKDESKIHFLNDFYKISINLLKIKEHKLKIFAEYNKEKRIPAFIELFGEKGSIVPNLKLRPELSFNREIGVNYLYQNILLDIRAYSKYVKDLIQFIPNSQFSLRAENIQFANINGYEISTKYKHKDILDLSFAYNYQVAKQYDPQNVYRKKNYIPLIPVHTFKSGIVLFPEGQIESHFEIFYYGAFIKNKSNDYFSYTPPKWIYNLSFYYRFQSFLTAYVEIRNLQNRWYEDIIGYPVPGRSYLIGLKYFF